MAATQADLDAAIATRNDIIERGSAQYGVEGITYSALDLDKIDRVIGRLRQEVKANTTGRHALLVEFVAAS